MIMTNDNDHNVNNDDYDNDADVTNVDEISFLGIGLWKENMVVEEVMAEAEAVAVADAAAASEAAVALKNKWNELFWLIWDL